MLASEKLLFEHPEGDRLPMPCTHMVPMHPEGHTVVTPCTHGLKQLHPMGDRIWTPFGYKRVPCIHLIPQHPEGDTVTVPCYHMVPQHPEGDPGPLVPCVHPLSPVSVEYGGFLVFYTDNQVIQNAVMDAVTRLNALGVSLITFQRPLCIFHRWKLTTGDGDDPFWSHYNALLHSIQIIDLENESDTYKLESIRHELGHALVGNQLINYYAWGSHRINQPCRTYALAMSEGWADFIALVLTYQVDGGRNINYYGLNWENMNIEPNGKVEYCVACCLWDLFDTLRIEGGQIVQDESAALAFTEFFKVYSPTPQTVLKGPVISSIWDFLDRIKANNSANSQLCQLIDQIALKNVGPRTTDLPSWGSNIDAAVTWPNGKTYFFKGDEYIRYDIATDRSDPGYPCKIKDGWPGLWESDIDAAVTWPNGKTYFFKGDEYIRYDIATDQADPGYPGKIRDGWPGLWESNIDDAVTWPNGKTYFFKGDEYIRYDIATDQTDLGYPGKIRDGWRGLWESNIDAAMTWPNGKTYFFKGDEYIRYDIATDQADPGYPGKIQEGWG